VTKKPTLSFLASHGGSAAKEIIRAIQNKTLFANIGLVITNNKILPFLNGAKRTV